MSMKDWEKLNVTRDEVNKIGEALKHKEFRELFNDYCEEIRDPENLKLYETELTQLEKERGVDITFINPQPGYVIKTSSNGTTKTFINIATNEKIDKPSNLVGTNADGQKGLIWSLPHSLTPPRRDVDKKGQLCHVYDVVFHPDALHLANRNVAFRQLVNDAALDAIQQSFDSNLDRINLRFPKISYKGIAKSAVFRKKIENFDASLIEPSPIDSIYPPMPDEPKSKKNILKSDEDPIIDLYQTPKYKIVQRREIEYHEMTHGIDAKLNLTIPHEIVVTIDLPLLYATKDVNLDVSCKRISLVSEKPAKYKLEIALPYEVKEENGTANFDKSKRQLIITLPVAREKNISVNDFHREDSGIESDQPLNGKNIEHSDESESSNELTSPEIMVDDTKTFLDSNIDYILPNFTFNQIDDIVAFTLHVKNVDPTSIVIDRKDFLNIAHIKFSSIGSGFFPIYYSFCVKFPSHYSSLFRDISAETWDNNVIFQFELNNYGFLSYEVGLNDANMLNYDIAERLIGRQAMTSQGKEIEDDSLSIEVRSDKACELIIDICSKRDSSTKKSQEILKEDDISEDVFDEKQSISKDGSSEIENIGRQTKKSMRKRMKKARSMSESYCDQLKVINELDALKLDNMKQRNDQYQQKNCHKKNNIRNISESSDDDHMDENDSFSITHHNKYKSILKNRYSLSEECNESSVDEQSKSLYSISADFGISESHDSLSESCKKQVRFSDIIKRQLFRLVEKKSFEVLLKVVILKMIILHFVIFSRSNTSILAQKKKNQKKKASRKRAFDRRYSEGSESEKHDDDFEKVNNSIYKRDIKVCRHC